MAENAGCLLCGADRIRACGFYLPRRGAGPLAWMLCGRCLALPNVMDRVETELMDRVETELEKIVNRHKQN